MFIVGLTGGIASGKTLVSQAFEKLGAAIVDADVLAREVVEPGSKGLAQLTEHFGSEILTDNKELNRAALRTLIFSNAEHRKTVDALLHPLIRQRSDRQLAIAAQKQAPYTVYAIPLLVETKQQDRFDRILVVDVPSEVQISRLMLRDNSTQEKAQAILDSQASRDERLAVADDVIDNTGTIESTMAVVADLHDQYLELAKQHTGDKPNY